MRAVEINSMQSSLLRLEQEDGENESSCTRRGSAWQCGLNKPRFKCGRGGTGQNITVLGQRDSLSFVHPLSICPSWGRACFKFSPCGMVQAGFPLMSGVRRAAQREAGSSNLDPTLALVVSYPPQVWARFLSVVKMSSLWISQSLCFLAFDCQHPLLPPKMRDSKRRTVVTS